MKCQMYVSVLGIMGVLLLAAIGTKIFLIFQIYKNRESPQCKNKDFLQLVRNLNDHICIENKDTNKGAKCLFCPKGWLDKGSKCYYMSSNKSSWDESQRYCSERNANLWMIKSEEEKSIAKDLYSRDCTSLNYLWIGLRAIEKLEWEWIDKTPNTVFGLTAPYNQNKCVQLYKCDTNSHFGADCSEQHVFLCEKKAIELDKTN